MIRTRSLCGAGGVRALTQCSRSRAEVRPEHRRLLRLRDAHSRVVRVLLAARGCLAACASSSHRLSYLLLSARTCGVAVNREYHDLLTFCPRVDMPMAAASPPVVYEFHMHQSRLGAAIREYRWQHGIQHLSLIHI